MNDVFLDSSVLIGLHFRHAGERAACRACLPTGSRLICSQYVIFEIARGFLRSLLTLYNSSFEFRSFSEMHQEAYSGANRFKPYRMGTWLGAMTDFLAALEQENVTISETQRLEVFRARLRGMIRRGWKSLVTDHSIIDDIQCQKNLPTPSLAPDGFIVQDLPTKKCGSPGTCGVQNFISDRQDTVRLLISSLTELSQSKKRGDTDKKHIPGLEHLLQTPVGSPFMGERCYECGDALICLEAPNGTVIATKNKRDFVPIAQCLSKDLTVAITSKSTTV